MREFTAKDAKHRFDQQLQAAQEGPVRVTRNSRPVGVMLSVEQFERLRGIAWDQLAAPMGRHERGGSRQRPDAGGAGVAP